MMAIVDAEIKVAFEFMPIPEKIIKSGDRTIVLWVDGTKTIVRREAGAEDSEYTAFTAALAIKMYGSNSAVKKIIENSFVNGDEAKIRREAKKLARKTVKGMVEGIEHGKKEREDICEKIYI